MTLCIQNKITKSCLFYSVATNKFIISCDTARKDLTVVASVGGDSK